jgi:periplasmic protein CpxP/Spy
MTQNSKVRVLVGFAASAAVVGMVAVGVSYAQQPPPPPRGGMMTGGQRQMMGGRGQMMDCRCWMPGGRGRMMGGRGRMMAGPMARMRWGLGQLGLSEQQKTTIKGIVEGHKADFQGLATRMQPARQALNTAIRSGANEATIRAKAAEVAAVQADMAVLRGAVRAQVFAVLTPEQQAKAKQLQEQAQQRRMGRRQGRAF